MKAAVLHRFTEPLRIEEVALPSLGADDVLLQVEACGVCHSDVHIAQGDWPPLAGLTKRPLILGHEVVGRVVERGEAVSDLHEGDRVGVAWLHWSCGQCPICEEGRENLCPAQKITGVTVDGGYAEFIRAKASHVVKVPDVLTPTDAAPLFCAGVTVYRAITRAGVKPGQRVALFGIGGLGHLAVQVVKALGAEVIAVDIAEEKLELARSLGADHILQADRDGVVSELRVAGGVHVAVVTSAAKAAYDTAFASLRPGGTLVVIGLPAEPLTFPAILLAATEARILASAVGTREDVRHTLALAAAGQLRCRVETHPLDHINDIFDRLRRAQILGRAVLRF